jgi:hypothetical protein
VDKKENKYLKNIDKQMVKLSNTTIVNSPLGYQFAKKYNKHTFLVPWGCNTNLFKNHKSHIPLELKQIKKPIIGMVGSINYRIDLKLLYRLALANPKWNFVLAGPLVDRNSVQNKLLKFDYHWGKLIKLDNIYYLGSKEKQNVPSIISAFDVCFIPYDINQEYNRGSHPMKFYEYLAMGKTMVATPIKALTQYSPPIIYFYNSISQAQSLLHKSLKSKTSKKIRSAKLNLAARNNWHQRINYILSAQDIML